MFVLSLIYPLHVKNFFAGLYPLVTFELFQTDDLYEEIFDLSFYDYDSGFTQQFMVVGYEYTSIIGNMGSLFAVLAITPLVVILSKVF
jgi:hypothetical protein